MRQIIRSSAPCVFALFLLTFITAPANTSTPDGQTPAEETVCDVYSGAAFGLCNAYCEAMDCELLDDADPLTVPNASERACLQVKDNFIRLTGEAALPCDCVDGEGQVGCACVADTDCLDGLTCDTGMCVEEDGGGGGGA